MIFTFGVFPVIGYVLYYYGLYNQAQPIITLGNLRFLPLLLIFSMVYVTYWLVRKPSSTRKRDFPGNTAILAFIMVMALVSFIIGIWAPINYWVPFGLFEPFHLTQYVMLFAAGIIASREGWIDAIPKATAMVWSVVAILMGIVI